MKLINTALALLPFSLLALANDDDGAIEVTVEEDDYRVSFWAYNATGTFKQAQTYCYNQGGDIAAIPSYDHYASVKALLSRDPNSDDRWLSQNNNVYNYGWSDWTDKWDFTHLGTEECVHWAGAAGGAALAECDEVKHIICQFEEFLFDGEWY